MKMLLGLFVKASKNPGENFGMKDILLKVSLVALFGTLFLTGCTDTNSRIGNLVEDSNASDGDIIVDRNRGTSSNSKSTDRTDPRGTVPIPGDNPRTPATGPSLDGGAPFDLAPSRESRIDDDFVPFANETDDVLLDLSRVEREDADDVPFTRYVSVGFLDYLNYKDEASKINDKIAMIDSMSILTNSLSTNDFITRPVAINKRMNVFRIDIRDYDWTQEQWEFLISADPNVGSKDAYPYNNDFDPNVATIADKIGTDVPIIRGDWMLFESGKPFVYHELASIAETLLEVEQTFGVDREDNILRTIDDPDSPPRAIRSMLGAGNSGVSTNNRIIERHEADGGVYWLSYDFPEVDGIPERDILQSPLGPNELGDFDGLSGFEPAGGEVIFNLDNGLQAYMLLDENFDRVNDAPTNVVFNPTDRLRGGVIENGYVCWSCHTNGMLKANDELRPFMNNLSAEDRDELYSDDVFDAVVAMHVPQNQLDSLIQKDSQFYLDAVEDSLILANSVPGQIATIASYYEFDMSFDMVASELNLSAAQLERVLPQLNQNLRSNIQASKSGKLQRKNFETIFPELLEEIFDLQQAPL